MKVHTAPLLLVGLLAACAASAELPTAVSELQPTPTTAESIVTSSPIATQASPQTGPSVPPRYDLRVAFDYGAHTLAVQEDITYTNNGSQGLDEVWLVVEPMRQGAGFSLNSLASQSGSLLGSSQWDNGVLHVALSDTLDPGQAIELSLDYTLILPQRTGLLGWSERQTNFVDWYPYIPPFVNNEWLVHEPSQVGEYGVYDSADFHVSIQVSNTPSGLLLAAPAPEERQGDTWQYTLEHARRFIWSASGHFRLLSGEQEGIPIHMYFFEEQRDAAEAALQVAREALATYTGIYGPYPYQSLSMVEALLADGMESDGLFFLDQQYFIAYSYNRQNYLTALTAHEIAHNWWFGQVGNDQALEPWLDESLCIYSELLYYEHVAPELVGWWWNFRIQRFNPSGWVDDSVYAHSGFSPYVQAVYMRGALFLQAVRQAIGDEAFFAFLGDYAQQGAGRIVTRADFFAVLQTYSDVELEPTIEDYFQN